MRKNYHWTLILLFLLINGLSSIAQKPKIWSSADIHEAIEKLNFLGSAMYVAAHPDDENQRIISYLSNEIKATTAYLSMTRGDGGQNEIGPEIQELLGIIRTQELLAARRVDGGSQLFTRANDFGYSKNPEETLEIWDHDEILGDVVWAIRKWQPDVIINRFEYDGDRSKTRRTHGHHTSSAILSYEAFDLAGDNNAYSDQLNYVDTWQPKRLFFNTSWWFYGSREKFAEADKSKMMSVDIGTFYPVLGRSNTEIAAAARSMHKAQGFGDMGSRGSQSEYIDLLKGDMPKNKEAIFRGINTSWSRVKGGEPIGKILNRVAEEYQFDNPSASVPQLMNAYRLIQELPDGFWKRTKLSEIQNVILACLGLYAEPAAQSFSAVPGETVELAIEVINRSNIPVQLTGLTFQPGIQDTGFVLVLPFNEENKIFKKVPLPEDMAYTSPYWLEKEWALGRYTVEDQLLRGLPETPRNFKVQFKMSVDGKPFVFTKEVVAKYEDAVKGEVYRPFEITPPVFANLAESAYIFGNNDTKTVTVRVKSGQENVKGALSLEHGPGWKVEPAAIKFELGFKGEEKLFHFELTPPSKQDESQIKPIVTVGGKNYDRELIIIDYDHIPLQTILMEAKAKTVRIDLEKVGDKIGYIMGLGDEIPASLEQIGYKVTLLEEGAITVDNLKNFDAVILGVRLYNGDERARFYQSKLMEYVKQGGTLITQYNKNYNMTVPMKEIAPYQLKISRDRVSVEDAKVRFLLPEHPLLNFPNEITKKDFDNWVQERGLYFPNEWGEEFEAIISANDPGEPARDGGLLVAKYGDGYYIYTGYSWFRQLPAGVPGAFRIFANMISIGQQEKR